MCLGGPREQINIMCKLITFVLQYVRIQYIIVLGNTFYNQSNQELLWHTYAGASWLWCFKFFPTLPTKFSTSMSDALRCSVINDFLIVFMVSCSKTKRNETQ